jgi:hypothetical protein
MKKIFFSLLIFGLTTQVYSQITALPETVISINYKYINAVNDQNSAQEVQMLEKEVALYNLKNSELYQDDYDSYYVSFYIPEGKIVAAYNKDGKIIRTIEKFKNTKLPTNVLNSVSQRFPGWDLTKDVYEVIYHNKKGVTKQQYKVTLKNGEKTLKVKLDPEGNYM